MPSTTSDSGRKATHALIIHKGGGMSGYAKKQGGNVRREVSGRKCPSPQSTILVVRYRGEEAENKML